MTPSFKAKAAALLWYKAGWVDEVVPPEQIVCYGCVSAGWCRYGIQPCASGKGVDNCGQCDDYPCDKILKAFEKAEVYAGVVTEKLSKEDCELFQRVFFSKKENPDKANREYLARRKRRENRDSE